MKLPINNLKIFLAFIALFHTVLSYAQVEKPVKPLPLLNKEFQVAIHIVLNKDSLPGKLTGEQLRSSFSGLNSYFEPIALSYRICEIRYIYNFNYDTIINEQATELVKHNLPHRINVYFVDSLYGSGMALCGLAGSGIIMRKGDCTNSMVLAHEFGHFFGLPHTFEGEGEELADGSNCETAGDGICDTPADPFTLNSSAEDFVTDDCVYYNTKKDANGQYYDPDVSNIMSYYQHCRCAKFTHGQYEKMARTYLRGTRFW